jgi:lysophospholipase L1-like esterase
MEEVIVPRIDNVVDSNESEMEVSSNSNTNEDNLPETIEIAELNYLALGDSYTIGARVTEAARWPVQLVKLLNKLGYNYVSPKIVARSGWTTSQLEAAILNENIKEEFNLVTLLIGVNNQFRGRSLDEFRKEFSSLLNKAIAFGKNNPANVIVVSIPDWGVTPVGQSFDSRNVSREIELFNDVKREETAIRDVKFVDITEISLLARNNSIYIAKDGLHYSGEMYKLWAEEIAKGF